MFGKSIVNELLIDFGKMLLIYIGLCTILFIIFKGLERLIKELIREEIRNNNYICDELKEDEDNEDVDTIQRAIIVIGDEKIEIDVDYYEIDDTTVEIESKDEKVYITDIKNVLLMSE